MRLWAGLQSVAVWILQGLVTVYQLTIRPLIGPRCRFEPTCSVYAKDALQEHGLFRGSWLAGCRLCRCRPGGPSGYDPVPPRSSRETADE